MKSIALSLLLLLCGRAGAPAQDSLSTSRPANHADTAALFAIPDSVWSVDSVMIVGNEQTKGFVILREMSLKPGDPITRWQIEYDKNRIYSLRLFNEVRMHVVPSTPPKANLVVEVSERWYIFPYPILGLRDRDWSKVFFGAGLVHTNFRGRAEKLNGSLIFGFDPSIGLSYRNPFLREDGSEFMEARISYSKVRNRSIEAQVGPDNFDERHYSLGGRYGRRLGIEHTFWVDAGFEVVEVTDYHPVPTIAPGGIDRYPVASVGYSYDSRDLGEYPGSGAYAGTTVTKYGWPSDELDIVRYAFDLRGYQPLSQKFVLTGRVYTNLAAGGRIPSYNHVYFGYGERIRGHFKEVMEGESLAGATTELHYTLLAPLFFRVSWLPPAFGVWKFGMVATIFADAGQTWFRGNPVAIDLFAKGYGAGIDFLLPYSAVLRMEYAFNEVRRGEFILEGGASF
jgi:outer membrane protein assembly factor BamA